MLLSSDHSIPRYTPSFSPLMDSNSLERLSPSTLVDINLPTISLSPTLSIDPILSHPSEPQLTSRDQPLYSTGTTPKRPRCICDVCGKKYAEQRGLNRHYRVKHYHNSCLYCGLNWSRRYLYRAHLKEHHPYVAPDAVVAQMNSVHLCMNCDVERNQVSQYKDHLGKHHPNVDPDAVVAQANSIHLCMYCDVEWNQASQYKDHLREHHPNVDPDAVLGETPGSLRWDKIIARYKLPGRRVRARRCVVSFMTRALPLPYRISIPTQ